MLRNHIGLVDFPKLDCFYTNRNCAGAPEANLTTAHNFGMLTKAGRKCDYNTDADLQTADQTCEYFGRPDGSEFAYRFLETNPNDKTTAFPYLTNRTIRASVSTFPLFLYSTVLDKHSHLAYAAFTFPKYYLYTPFQGRRMQLTLRNHIGWAVLPI